ncbi:MAG: hypothetical protein ACI8XB_001867 [Patiriisocius sp.]
MNKVRDIFIGKRFLLYSGVVILCFALSYALTILFPIAQGLLILYIILMIADLTVIFNAGISLRANRIMPEVLSLGDDNPVEIEIKNDSEVDLKVDLIDELPHQFQTRNLSFEFDLAAQESKTVKHDLRPLTRGEYAFGDIVLYAQSFLSIFKRRITLSSAKVVNVYPSIMQMKSFELIAFSRVATMSGVKKLRRIGASYEFEKIKSYVQGDDIRHINWKATGKRSQLMVNLFEIERSQPIYSVICKSREMMMPFNGLSLLDYAVNTSLAISNIALLKHDKMGLITFSDKIGTTLKASSNKLQLKKILRALFNEKERETEANYELLYRSLSTIATQRALLFLFVNFESLYALERALPILRRINKRHLLVVVFFRNTEIEQYAKNDPEDLREIYQKTIATKLNQEKATIVAKLRQTKIQTVLTTPEDLSMDTINKYLELKSRGAV